MRKTKNRGYVFASTHKGQRPSLTNTAIKNALSGGTPMSQQLNEALAHVFWLGGPSDAGKTTVANILLGRRRWQGYPCDLHEHNHLIARVDPVRHPASYRALGRSVEESWLQPTPEALFEHVLVTNDERFPMICDDLRVMPHHPPVLAEGPRLFPKLLEPVLSSRHQALWLLPTEVFVRASQVRRDKPLMRHRSSDPERFRDHFMARERLLAEYVRNEVLQRGLPYIEVDGQRSPEEIAGLAEAHFAEYTPVEPSGVDARLARPGGLSYLAIPAADCRRSDRRRRGACGATRRRSRSTTVPRGELVGGDNSRPRRQRDRLMGGSALNVSPSRQTPSPPVATLTP